MIDSSSRKSSNHAPCGAVSPPSAFCNCCCSCWKRVWTRSSCLWRLFKRTSNVSVFSVSSSLTWSLFERTRIVPTVLKITAFRRAYQALRGFGWLRLTRAQVDYVEQQALELAVEVAAIVQPDFVFAVVVLHSFKLSPKYIILYSIKRADFGLCSNVLATSSFTSAAISASLSQEFVAARHDVISEALILITSLLGVLCILTDARTPAVLIVFSSGVIDLYR